MDAITCKKDFGVFHLSWESLSGRRCGIAIRPLYHCRPLTPTLSPVRHGRKGATGLRLKACASGFKRGGLLHSFSRFFAFFADSSQNGIPFSTEMKHTRLFLGDDIGGESVRGIMKVTLSIKEFELCRSVKHLSPISDTQRFS